MANDTSKNTISVVIEHSREDKQTVALFEWSAEPPHDTYTIDIGSSLSLELDTHFPVRPSRVTWYETNEVGSDAIISGLFGSELPEAMRQARNIGFTAMELSIDRSVKIAVANKQVNSPSTPPLLRKACAAMLGELLSNGS